MAQGEGGSIILISSSAGIKGQPFTLGYTASKHGITGLMKALSNELGEYRIRVNSIHPAGVETDMLRQFDDGEQGSLLAGIPIGRFGSAAEVAEVVAWLTSPASDFITGQTINVNGGAYLG